MQQARATHTVASAGHCVGRVRPSGPARRTITSTSPAMGLTWADRKKYKIKFARRDPRRRYTVAVEARARQQELGRMGRGGEAEDGGVSRAAAIIDTASLKVNCQAARCAW